MKAIFRSEFDSDSSNLPRVTIDFGSGKGSSNEESAQSLRLAELSYDALIAQGFGFQEDGTFLNPHATQDQIKNAQKSIARLEAMQEKELSEEYSKHLKDFLGRDITDKRPDLKMYMNPELRKAAELEQTQSQSQDQTQKKAPQQQSGEAQLDSELNKILEELKAVKAQNENLSRQIEDLKEQNKKLTAEITAVREENKKLKEDIQKMRQTQQAPEPEKAYQFRAYENNGKKFLNYVVNGDVKKDDALAKEMGDKDWKLGHSNGHKYFYQEVREGQTESQQKEAESILSAHGMYKVSELPPLDRGQSRSRGQGRS